MRGATAAGKLMALHRLFDKAGGLFLSLSLVARKPHPLPNDGPARLLFVHFVAPYYCKFPQRHAAEERGKSYPAWEEAAVRCFKENDTLPRKTPFSVGTKGTERRPWLRSCFCCHFGP